MSFTSFLDNMPQNLKTDFNEEFKNEYMQKKVIFKRRQNNEEQTVILDMYRVLIVYARKWRSYIWNYHRMQNSFIFMNLSSHKYINIYTRNSHRSHLLIYYYIYLYIYIIFIETIYIIFMGWNIFIHNLYNQLWKNTSMRYCMIYFHAFYICYLQNNYLLY